MPVIGADDLRVTHPSASCSEELLDLHVLSMPPAFVLSQDQTLRCRVLSIYAPNNSLLVYVISKTINEVDPSYSNLPSCLFPVVKEHREKKQAPPLYIQGVILCSALVSRGRATKIGRFL